MGFRSLVHHGRSWKLALFHLSRDQVASVTDLVETEPLLACCSFPVIIISLQKIKLICSTLILAYFYLIPYINLVLSWYGRCDVNRFPHTTCCAAIGPLISRDRNPDRWLAAESVSASTGVPGGMWSRSEGLCLTISSPAWPRDPAGVLSREFLLAPWPPALSSRGLDHEVYLV